MRHFKFLIFNFSIFLVTSIILFSTVLFATEVTSTSAEKLASNMERFKNWYGKSSVALKDSDGRLIDLNIEKRNTGQTEVTLSSKQELALHDEINRNVHALCAKSFNDYHESLKRVVNGGVSIKQTGYMKMRRSLRQSKTIRRPELLTDYGLAEAYWMFTSKIGHMNTYFTDLVSSESFYRLKEILDSSELDTYPDPFPDDRKSCGCISQPAAFTWNGVDPHTEFKSMGKLLIADIRYMIKTNMENIAYPICVRVYWSEDLGKWIPWFCFEYNIQSRYCNVVF